MFEFKRYNIYIYIAWVGEFEMSYSLNCEYILKRLESKKKGVANIPSSIRFLPNPHAQ